MSSLETRPGDEILLVAETAKVEDTGAFVEASSFERVRVIECSRGNDWGHHERNFAMLAAEGGYIAHIDDDDIFTPGTREAFDDAIREDAEQRQRRLHIFRMRFPNGITLWREKIIRCGNLGTPCIFHPNEPASFGQWMPYVGGDCAFLETSVWPREGRVRWWPHVVARLGHDIGRPL
jgi:hypothetical protein